MSGREYRLSTDIPTRMNEIFFSPKFLRRRKVGQGTTSIEIPTSMVEELEKTIQVGEEMSRVEYRDSTDIATRVDKTNPAPSLEEGKLGKEQEIEMASDDETESQRSQEGETTGKTRLRGSFTAKLLPITPTHKT